MSPVYFILTSLAFTSAMLSAIFFMAWTSLGRMPHALTWSVTFLLATLQWTINLNSARFPSTELYWVIVSLITLAVATLGLLGHCQRVGRKISIRELWLPPLVCLAAITWFTYGSTHEGLRTALQPAFAAATMVISAILILRHRKRPQPAEWGAALSLIVFATTQIVAAGAALLQGADFSQAYYDVYRQVNFLALPAAYTGTGMFVVFMLASDLSAQLKEAAVRDDLTGLLNRRGFCEASATTYSNARRSGRPVSVVMTDIDFFKDINDTFGHATGDEALRFFAGVMAEQRRAEDILARIGGEEFALILPGCDDEQSIEVAQTICNRVMAASMRVGIDTLTMTASFGVATLTAEDAGLSDAIVRADGALYQAKNNGRNRVERAAPRLTLLPNGRMQHATA